MRELRAELEGYALEPVLEGESGAKVVRCTKQGAPSFYLKSATLVRELDLNGEAKRLRWMRDRGVRVTAVRGYLCTDLEEQLLLEEAPGLAASDSHWSSSPRELIDALGRALAELHRTGIADCPFDHRIARRVADAHHQVQLGRVDESDFEKRFAGQTAAQLFELLLASIPPEEDSVFTHGDFTFENTLLERAPDGELYVSAFIDCGRAGIADRYQDIALAIRSIEDAFGADSIPPFLDAYGVRELDEKKLDFFLLLDEFF